MSANASPIRRWGLVSCSKSKRIVLGHQIFFYGDQPKLSWDAMCSQLNVNRVEWGTP